MEESDERDSERNPSVNGLGFRAIQLISAVSLVPILAMIAFSYWQTLLARQYFEAIDSANPQTVDELQTALTPLLDRDPIQSTSDESDSEYWTVFHLRYPSLLFVDCQSDPIDDSILHLDLRMGRNIINRQDIDNTLFGISFFLGSATLGLASIGLAELGRRKKNNFVRLPSILCAVFCMLWVVLVAFGALIEFRWAFFLA